MLELDHFERQANSLKKLGAIRYYSSVVKPLVVFAAALLWLSGCSSKPAEVADLNITEVTFPNGKTVAAETMLREIDQMRGMMFRDSLAQDRGMLFVHPHEGNYPYWMYQVRIPLDIIWMDHAAADRRDLGEHAALSVQVGAGMPQLWRA